MVKEFIEFIDLKAQQERLGDRVLMAIENVLTHGKYIMGPEVGELERKLGEFCGARHVISCASGTDALLLALMAYGIKPGDAVFVPSFTFVATAEVVVLIGAIPVFVDVDPDYFLMDMESLKSGLKVAQEAGLNPKAIIPVDLFGQPADYNITNSFAEENNLLVIADAAQSFGGSKNGKKVGSLAKITATSFFPAKPLGCYGDGGAVFTDDGVLADKIRSIRMHGKGTDKYDNVNIGINGRLDTIQAAILIEKLEIFADEIESRAKVAARYSEYLRDKVDVPVLRENTVSAWAQYTVKVEDRDSMTNSLKAAGIPTAVYYPKPLHQQTAYKNYPTAKELPVSEKLSKMVLSMPMHPYLDEETQDYIIANVQ